MTMHILFFTDNFPPESNAPASRTYEHAREWVSAGRMVTIITCVPNFPQGRVFSGYQNKLWQSEIIGGIRVIRVWSFIARNEGFIKRILDYTSFMITGFIASFFVRKVDIVVGTSPQFFAACAAWAAATVKRRPFVFELRDIWPESIRAVGAISSPKILDFFERIELFLYRQASAVIAVTHSFKENLIRRGIYEHKIHVITNGVDISRFSPLKKNTFLLNELELEGRFIVGYIGTIGMAHALETLVEAARLLINDPDARDVLLLFLGDGANRTALIASAKGLNNVVFLESVSKDKVASFWSLLDVSIIHLKKNDLFKTVIPSKMFECMAMGIPILHGVEGESAEIIQTHNAGLLFEPENAVALCQALKKVKSDVNYYNEISQSAVLGAKNFDRKILAQRMLSILDKVSLK